MAKGSDDLSKYAEQYFKEGRPIRRTIDQQLMDILHGDMTTDSTVPLIQSGVNASKFATANTLKQLRDAWAGGKIEGTPFAAGTEAMARIAGNQATAAIPTNIGSAFLSQFGPNAFMSANAGLGGLGAAANAQANESAGMLSMFGQFGQGLGSIFGGKNAMGGGGGLSSLFSKGSNAASLASLASLPL